MVKSMTGYGKHQGTFSGKTITVELRSVNQRHLDCSFKLPRNCLFMEGSLREKIQSEVHRGKVEVYLSVDEDEVQETLQVNHEVAQSYYTALCEVAQRYQIPLGLTAVELMSFSDVMCIEKTSPLESDPLLDQVLLVLEKALSDFTLLRQVEGEKIQKDLLEKTDTLEEIIIKIENKVPKLVEEYQLRLTEKVTRLLENVSMDAQRILTEVALFADKIAIDEEIVRLHSHIALLRTLLRAPEPVGRKLDFLIQEFNREMNTIGSKSSDLELSHWVVDLKSVLEKIREQAQNIE